MSTQSRKPRGTPVGGQFASRHRAESTCQLKNVTKEVVKDESGTLDVWRDSSGDIQDPPSGEPAVRQTRIDGSVALEYHYQGGKRQDSPSGDPAERWFRTDGSVELEYHYQAGTLQDPPSGEPAMCRFHPDGSVELEYHYQTGTLQDPSSGEPAMRRFRLPSW